MSVRSLFSGRSARLAAILTAATLATAGCTDDEDAPPLDDSFDPASVDDGELVVAEEQSSLASLELEAAVPEATCTVTVTPASQLMITNLAVVNDAVRTKWTGALTNAADGAWHFGRLMTQMAGANDPEVFVRSWLAQWQSNVVVNGLTVPARNVITSQVITPWPKLANGKLDLTKAPFRLLAIVNRFDLRSAGNAGEGRFVFGVLGPGGSTQPFTVILEYKMPAATAADVKTWAHLWRDLSTAAVGTAAYRTKLQAITDRFAKRNAAPGRINGSAISQVRTNENALNPVWELREFRLTTTGQLRMAPPALNPADSFNNTATLATFMTNNATAIKAQTHTIPAKIGTTSFAAGSVINNIDFWRAPGITDSLLRHRLSVNTCDGCHGRETNTFFLHVAPRAANAASALSGFLTGTTVPDPLTGANRSFGDLAKRANILKTFLCANP